MEEQQADSQRIGEAAGEHPVSPSSTVIWHRPERRKWPRVDLRPFGPQGLRIGLITQAPNETPIGARVKDISQGGLGIETVRPIVLPNQFPAELIAARAPDPVRIEAKPIWQQPLNRGQRWGLAVIKPWPLIQFIGILADAEVEIETRRETFTLKVPQANQVSIAGDFNDWNTHSHPLQKDPLGVWQISLSLPPGRYEYQFFVDGWWSNDPKSAKRTPNLFGTENDVIEVPAS